MEDHLPTVTAALSPRGWTLQLACRGTGMADGAQVTQSDLKTAANRPSFDGGGSYYLRFDIQRYATRLVCMIYLVPGI